MRLLSTDSNTSFEKKTDSSFQKVKQQNNSEFDHDFFGDSGSDTISPLHNSVSDKADVFFLTARSGPLVPPG